ncbi:MAG TPA: hypothetical protein GXX17_03670 [Clostridiales bacterium]|nr:hypothetical protein [Clostridiales bacterium]
MFDATSFEAIPQAYPNNINSKKGRLLPLLERDLKDLKIESGQDIPKLITINASNKLLMLITTFNFFRGLLYTNSG